MSTPNQSERISYAIMPILLILVASLHLGTLVLTSLFGYFALQLFSLNRSKILGVVVYLIAVITIGGGIVFFLRQAYITLPEIADTSIPAMAGFAEKHGLELPFTDFEGLKSVAMDEAKQGIAGIGSYARAATFQFVLLAAGLVVSLSLFLRPAWEKDSDGDNLYGSVVRQLATRFTTFYQSFKKVIGAQLVISTINAGLTAVFLLINGYPFTAVLVVLTLLCGLLPIVGNLMSNTLIVGVGFTVSPRTALFALFFLIAIHKLEYFLNSKIIGDRIKSPVWLTLIGLILGEELMGIPGMILAPVILYYVRIEASGENLAGDPKPHGKGDSLSGPGK